MKKTKYRYIGNTANRPDNLTANDTGYEYFDTEKNIVSFWNGAEWVELSSDSQEGLVVLSPENGEVNLTTSSLQSLVITENITINLPTIEKDYWEAKLYIKGQKGNVVTLKEGDITDEIELGCDKQHALKIVKINGEFNAELIDYSPEGSTEEDEAEPSLEFIESINLSSLENGVYEIENASISKVADITGEFENTNASITGMIVKGSQLTKFVNKTETQLNDLIFVDCDNLQRVHLLNCPLSSNKNSLLRMCKHLKDRNGGAWGSVVLDNQDVRKEIELEFIKKDWYFGSPLIYDEKAYKHLDGNIWYHEVQDVWESAEYGEGLRVAIADSGFADISRRDEFPDIDYDKLVATYNINNDISKQNDMTPMKEWKNNHGFQVSHILLGTGKECTYGAVPKAEFVWIKIGGVDSSSNNEFSKVCELALKENCMFVNRSYGGGTVYLSDHEEYIPSMSAFGKYITAGGVFVNSSGNESMDCETEYGAPAIRMPYFANGIIGAGGVTDRHDIWSNEYYDPRGNGSEYYYGYSKNEDDMVYYSVSTGARGLCFLGYSSIFTRNGMPDSEHWSYDEFSGTSCSAPTVTGCLMIGSNLYKKKYGKTPNVFELIDFLKHRTDCPDSNLTPTQEGYGAIRFLHYREEINNVEELEVKLPNVIR